jgi:hypothetical protein
MKKIVAALVILALTFMVLAAVLIAIGHASATTPRTPERKVVEDLSQVVTLHGFVLDVKLLGTQEDIYTNVRIRAHGMPQDVSLLFCGYQGDDIAFGPMELKFQTASPKKYRDIGCFTLVSAKREEPK